MSQKDDVITINIQPFLMPMSVVLSSIFISMAILFGLNNIAANVKGTNTNTGTNTGTDTGTDTGSATGVTYQSAATDLGLDSSKIQQCVTDKTYQSLIDKHIADGSAAGVAGTPGFIIGRVVNNTVEGLRVKGAYPITTFQEILDAYISNNQSKIDEIANRDDANEPGSKEFPRTTTPITDSGVLGDSSKSIAIVEYTDLDCFFCQRNHKQVFPTIKSSYIDSGKAFYVTRNFPIVSLHPDANNKALAAECVRAQYGNAKYYEYIDKFLSQ